MISVKKKPAKAIALAVFYTLALALALILIFHNNPLEDPQTAMLKKVCGCILIAVGSILVFVWYDRLTVLPVELWNSRKLTDLKLMVSPVRKAGERG